MTDLNNRSDPETPPSSDKNPFFSLPPSFWHEKKLVVASAWVLIAVGLVALTFLNHKKPQQAPSVQAAVSAPEMSAPEAAPEPFDITLSSTESEATETPKVIKVSAEKPLAEKVAEETIRAEKKIEMPGVIVKKAEKSVAEKTAPEKKDAPKAKIAEKKTEARKDNKPKASEAKDKKPAAETKATENKADVKKTAPSVKIQKTEPVLAKPKESTVGAAEQQAEMAREFMLKGDVKQAMVHQHRAVEMQPNNMFYRLNLGVMHDRVSDREGAATLYRQVIDAYEKKDQTLPKINVDDVRRRLDYISNEE